MDHEQFKNNAAAYSLGALEADERQAFETHLAEGCPECRALVRELQTVTTMLAYSPEEVAPPSHLKTRILDAIQPAAASDRMKVATGVAAIRTSVEQALQQAMNKWRRLSLGLAVALAATVAFFLMQTARLSDQNQSLSDQLQRSQTKPAPLDSMKIRQLQRNETELAEYRKRLEESEMQVESLQSELAESASAREASERAARALRQELEQMAVRLTISGQLLDSLSATLAERERFLQDNLKLIDLRGLEPSPAATGRIHLIPTERTAVFFGFDLPQSPAGRDYQLWVIRDGQPVDAGIFNPAADGRAVALVKAVPDIDHINAFAVTLEPKGGVPQPTGQMYLLGQTSGG